MKATTKFQKQIVELSSRVKEISQSAKKYALKHCLNHEAIRLKSGKTSCLDCGHQWEEPMLEEFFICPSCKTQLKTVESRKTKFRDLASFHVFSTIENFQVIRMFEIGGWYRVGEPAIFFTKEVSRIFLNEKGKYEIIGYNFNWYYGTWNGDFSLKQRKTVDSHNRVAYVNYPKFDILPTICRNGFDGNFHGIAPLSFFRSLMISNYMETLLKSNQIELFKFFHTSRSYIVEDFWTSIKVCIRNNYIVSDGSIWIDYIQNLKELGKDIRSPFYVCPTDLKKSHDKYLEKIREIRRKKRLLKIKEEMEKSEENYFKQKQRFFGLTFTEDNITIKVLETVEDFMIEGKKLNHCIFENKYFEKEESLLFSARVDDEITETVEVSLINFKILQARGYGNEASPYNERIIQIVKNNIKLIKKRLKKPKKVV